MWHQYKGKMVVLEYPLMSFSCDRSLFIGVCQLWVTIPIPGTEGLVSLLAQLAQLHAPLLLATCVPSHCTCTCIHTLYLGGYIQSYSVLICLPATRLIILRLPTELYNTFPTLTMPSSNCVEQVKGHHNSTTTVDYCFTLQVETGILVFESTWGPWMFTW